MPSRAAVSNNIKDIGLIVKTRKRETPLSRDLLYGSTCLFCWTRCCDIFFMADLRNLNANELMKKI